MIEFKNIYKTFNEKEILKDVSFKIMKGDSIAIIGQSGVGKSVLIKHINGLLQPDSGTVHINGKILSLLNYREIQKLRAKMAMVFQFGALFDSMNIEENILLGLKSVKQNKKNINQSIVNDVLERVNLNGVNLQFPSDISGGMRKRVGIARAIAIDPEIILYDEPTTGLDPISTNEINGLIKKVHSDNVTSIIVTHELKTVFDVSNKVIMLYDGQIIFEGTPNELKRSKDKYIRYFITGEKH